MTELEKLDKKYIAPTYNRFPVDILNGKGSVVFDRQGKRYIDMGSGIGVTAFGISDGDWIKAVTDQLSMVQHMSNLYYTEPAVLLARLLCLDFTSVHPDTSCAAHNPRSDWQPLPL